MNWRWTIFCLFLIVPFSSCKREQRSFRAPPAAVELTEDVQTNSPLRPGPATQATDSTLQAVSVSRLINEPYAKSYPNDAQALSDGQTLFESYNCSGCHAHGGGGMGPPLMDKLWLYGSDSPQVYQTILEGRPNGMPSFRGRIPDYQIWELVAFVRSMSGQVSHVTAPGREDHMAGTPPPNSIPKQMPMASTEPTTGPARRPRMCRQQKQNPGRSPQPLNPPSQERGRRHERDIANMNAAHPPIRRMFPVGRDLSRRVILRRDRSCSTSVALSILFTLSGCSAELHSPESTLAPAGPQAQSISLLTWVFLGVCAVVYVLVMLALAGAFLHRRRGEKMGPSNDPLVSPQGPDERRLWIIVVSAIVITVLTLFALLFSDFATGRKLRRVTESSDPLRIQVIGHQWWWEVKYLGWPARFGEPFPSNEVTTANEIHIPADPEHPIAVEFMLESHDVIHSFWVPNLHGKKDLIPGHPTTLWLAAERPGTYYGDCAEFCGYQHAQMRLVVIAEPIDQFQKWLAAQRQIPPDPSNDMQRRGQEVFLHASCAMCHSIAGTRAGGLVGPDLSHVNSRKLLAAGAVPNVRGHLAGWIIDPQRIKPGTHMPQNNLSAQDLRALLEYLETLN